MRSRALFGVELSSPGDLTTYNTAITACEQGQQLDVFIHLIAGMDRMGLTLGFAGVLVKLEGISWKYHEIS